ncbi:MAG: lysophospholipid acyltransferase family protein [Gemmatimonadaceae bacterium]
MIRAVLFALTLLVSSVTFGGMAILAGLFRVRDRPGSPYDLAPRLWGRTSLWVAGVTIVEHDAQRKHADRHVFVANHTGNIDVLALGARLPWIKFVAKAELFRIPVFGKAMLAAGMVPIERANRKAAFDSYTIATARIASGASVAVYPEGTRGHAYPLRPFKKGPFVLAIQAQAPIVPVVIHGGLEVQRKGRFAVRPGVVHMHYLAPIATTGLTYDDRTTLARRTYEAMAECLQREYGVVSPPFGTT